MENEMIELAITKMINVFSSLPAGVEHTLKVLENTIEILMDTDCSEFQQDAALLAAIFHDCGVVESLRKYNSMEGHLQEKEGRIVADLLLTEMGVDVELKDRVTYIVGNHHSPTKIDGIDFRIVYDADLLENLITRDFLHDRFKLTAYIDANFSTSKGREMASTRYLTST